MVKETIKAVEEAEKKAEDILKEAGEQINAMIDKAKEDALLLKEREKNAAGEKAAKALESAKSEMKEVEDLCNQETQKQVQALKQNAAAKEPQAIEAVIKALY